MLLSIEVSKHGSQGLWFMQTYLHTWQSCHHFQNLKPNSKIYIMSLYKICEVSGLQIDLSKPTLLLFMDEKPPKRGHSLTRSHISGTHGLRLYLQTAHQKGHGNIFYNKYPSWVQLLFLLVCVCW